MQQTDLGTAIARARRQDPFPAEGLLWQALRNRRFLGLKARRQTPLAGQIVAFYLPEARLAITFDPGPPGAADLLATRGFRHLRLDRRALAADLPGSLARIAAACRQPIDPPGPI